MRNLDLLWALLIALTLISEFCAGSAGGAAFPHTIVVLLVFTIALVKVGLVAMNMMEVRDAPRALRLVAIFWVALAWLGLTTFSLSFA